MSVVKEWKTGRADEAWKIAICSRDLVDIETAILKLCDVVVKDPKNDFDSRVEALMSLTSTQILDAVLGYRESCIESIANAIIVPTEGDN